MASIITTPTFSIKWRFDYLFQGFLLGVYIGRTLQGSGSYQTPLLLGRLGTSRKGISWYAASWCQVYGDSEGPISVHELSTFRHLPKEGAVYELSGFDVSRSNPNYRLSDSPFSVQFTDLTSFVELSNPAKSIRIEHLRLRNYDQLMVVANTNTDLPGY